MATGRTVRVTVHDFNKRIDPQILISIFVKILKSIISILLLSLVGLSFFFTLAREAHAEASPEEVEALLAQLAKAKTPADSLVVLYDLFDARTQANKHIIGWKILDVAERTNNQGALAEFIPQMANMEMKDSKKIQQLLDLCNTIENEQTRKCVTLFTEIVKTINEATYMSEADRQKALVQYAQADMSHYDDIYAEILDLARLVMFMGMSTQSSMYLEYLTRIERLVDQLPDEAYYVRNTFYTRGAMAHTEFGNHEKALETDRKLLEVIKGLEEKYAKMGRKYRNYDRYKYISYRRMLRNYDALSIPEIEDLYNKCVLLAETNSDVQRDFNNGQAPTIYRLMAEKKYKEAIPKLQKLISLDKTRGLHRELLRMLVQAADSVGDKTTLLSALKEYNSALQETLKQRSVETYREMQVRYDVNQLERDNTRLSIEKKNMEVASVQRLVTISLAAMLLLAVIIMILYRRHFILKQKMAALKIENGELHDQIEDILNAHNPAGSEDLYSFSQEHPDIHDPSDLDKLNKES